MHRDGGVDAPGFFEPGACIEGAKRPSLPREIPAAGRSRRPGARPSGVAYRGAGWGRTRRGGLLGRLTWSHHRRAAGRRARPAVSGTPPRGALAYLAQDRPRHPVALQLGHQFLLPDRESNAFQVSPNGLGPRREHPPQEIHDSSASFASAAGRSTYHVARDRVLLYRARTGLAGGTVRPPPALLGSGGVIGTPCSGGTRSGTLLLDTSEARGTEVSRQGARGRFSETRVCGTNALQACSPPEEPRICFFSRLKNYML